MALKGMSLHTPLIETPKHLIGSQQPSCAPSGLASICRSTDLSTVVASSIAIRTQPKFYEWTSQFCSPLGKIIESGLLLWFWPVYCLSCVCGWYRRRHRRRRPWGNTHGPTHSCIERVVFGPFGRIFRLSMRTAESPVSWSSSLV